MCLDDEAQLVLFTALDVTECAIPLTLLPSRLTPPFSDTKLISKSIVAEIVNVAPKLYTTVQGRRALLYLVVPRSRRHFTPAQIANMAETDETRSRTSKKAPEAREGEIRKYATEALISWIQDEGATLIRDPGASLVVTDIMLHADGGQ